MKKIKIIREGGFAHYFNLIEVFINGSKIGELSNNSEICLDISNNDVIVLKVAFIKSKEFVFTNKPNGSYKLIFPELIENKFLILVYVLFPIIYPFFRLKYESSWLHYVDWVLIFLPVLLFLCLYLKWVNGNYFKLQSEVLTPTNTA